VISILTPRADEAHRDKIMQSTVSICGSFITFILLILDDFSSRKGIDDELVISSSEYMCMKYIWELILSLAWNSAATIGALRLQLEERLIHSFHV